MGLNMLKNLGVATGRIGVAIQLHGHQHGIGSHSKGVLYEMKPISNSHGGIHESFHNQTQAICWPKSTWHEGSGLI